MKTIFSSMIIFAVLLSFGTLACALPTPESPHMVTCDALPSSDNDTGANIYYSQNIISISKANPGVVTTALAHGLANGAQGVFWGLAGMTQLNGAKVTITVINSTSFSIGVNTSSYGAYTAGSGGFFDDGHRIVNGRIDTAPYDLKQLTLPVGIYPIAGTAVNANGESGFSNAVPFTVPPPAPVTAPPNFRIQ